MKYFLHLLTCSLFAFSSLTADIIFEEEIDDDFDIEEDPCEVYVPNFTPGFELDISFLALKSSFNDLEYAASINPSGVVIPQWQIKAIKPDFAPTFELGLGYYFENTGNNLKITWLHQNTEDTNYAHGIGEGLVTPLFNVGDITGQYVHAKGILWNHFDRVHLTGGQFIDMGEAFNLRVFGGADFVFLDRKIHSRFSNRDNAIRLKIEQRSCFIGGGPMIGAHFIYHLCEGFGLVGEITGACLTGRKESDMGFRDRSPVGATVGFAENYSQNITSDSSIETLLGAEAKVGISYAYQSDCWCVRLEAGYKAGVYPNMTQSLKALTVSSPPELGTVAISSIGKTTGDFSFGGPYLSLGVDY